MRHTWRDACPQYRCPDRHPDSRRRVDRDRRERVRVAHAAACVAGVLPRCAEGSAARGGDGSATAGAHGYDGYEEYDRYDGYDEYDRYDRYDDDCCHDDDDRA